MPIVTVYVKGRNWHVAKARTGDSTDFFYNEGQTSDFRNQELREVKFSVPRGFTRADIRLLVDMVNLRRP